ncbi:hypothetical protein MHN80_01005 [Gordonia McavH-238-E]|uniref:hypothetical protein n=1 Tax=Gordonia sp. McavH-238-E TaxID=2917736 RepID=UPI001EF58DB5|nr:hypothetical protein [Gordonia sp. McavH-238-E]MCG7630882.1 hypothetical protein [Gordonia sp. McavH-238-E]
MTAKMQNRHSGENQTPDIGGRELVVIRVSHNDILPQCAHQLCHYDEQRAERFLCPRVRWLVLATRVEGTRARSTLSTNPASFSPFRLDRLVEHDNLELDVYPETDSSNMWHTTDSEFGLGDASLPLTHSRLD